MFFGHWPSSLGALVFFGSQGVGILFEEGVQELWRRVVGAKDARDVDPRSQNGEGKCVNGIPAAHKRTIGRPAPPLPLRILGYLWTVTFLTVTLSAWVRPQLSAGLLEERMPLRIWEGVLYGRWL